MHNDLTIRVASAADYTELKTILDNTPTDWSPDILFDCFSSDYVVWVIGDSNNAMGLVVVRNNADVWEIMQIVVDAQYQRRGLAEKLLQHVIQEAKKQVIKTLQLEVRVSNTAALSLYEKTGFIRVGLRKKYYSNGEDAVLMDFVSSDRNARASKREPSN